MKQIFYGMEKISLVDYEGYVVCTLFTKGCNFHCKWCHNGPLVNNEVSDYIDFSEIKQYLLSRKNIIDGVCITGGEATLNPLLPYYIKEIKNLGLKVKLDTNGTNSFMLQELLNENLLDYVAMDIKGSLNNYHIITDSKNPKIDEIKKSINILINGNIDYEFRTTLVEEYHNLKEIEEIGKLIKGAKVLYLQQFVEKETCIKQGFHSIPKEKALEYKSLLEKYVSIVNLRGY